MRTNLRTIVTDYILTPFDDNIEVDATAGDVTITLPDNASVQEKIYSITVSTNPNLSNIVLLAPTGTDTINAILSSYNISEHDLGTATIIQSDGSGEWKMLNRSVTPKTGRYLYVGVDGNNATAEIGNSNKPWRDPWAAKDAATIGDLVVVFAGEYTSGGINTGADVEDDGTNRDATSLWKDGVTYQFDAGSVLRGYNIDPVTQRTIDQPFFYTANAGVESCTVTGLGTFIVENGNLENDLGSGEFSAVNNFATTVFQIDNPDATFSIEGQEVQAAEYGFRILRSAQINGYFRKAVKGTRYIIDDNSDGSLANYTIDNLDASTRKPSDMIQTYGGIEQLNYNRGIVSCRSTAAKITVNFTNIYLETTGEGVTQKGGSHAQNGNLVLYNIGNYVVKDAMQEHNPNTEATGILTVSAILPSDGDTVTVGAQTYTWKTALTGAADEILIGASRDDCRKYFANALQGRVASYGVDIGTGTVRHPDVRALYFGLPTGESHLYAKVGGTAGNSIATTSTGTEATFAAATLLGGLNDGAKIATDPGAMIYECSGGPDMADSVENFIIGSLESPFGLLEYAYSNAKNHICNMEVGVCKITGNETVLNINLPGSTTGTGAIVRADFKSLTQDGEAAILNMAGTTYPPTEDFKVELSGSIITNATTVSSIINDLDAGENDIVLKNLTVKTGATNVLESTNAQDFRVMNMYSNKVSDVNSTELIEAIVVDVNVI